MRLKVKFIEMGPEFSEIQPGIVGVAQAICYLQIQAKSGMNIKKGFNILYRHNIHNF